MGGQDLNSEFAKFTKEIPDLFRAIMNSPFRSFEETKRLKDPGIYVLFEFGVPVYVGRTRNIGQRLKSHTTPSINKASFAIKLARIDTKNYATYKKESGKKELFKNEAFVHKVIANVERIKTMEVKFLIVTDPIHQYLLELYAALELGTSQSEFDTH